MVKKFTLEEFIKEYDTKVKSNKEVLIYRGQNNQYPTLMASIYRDFQELIGNGKVSRDDLLMFLSKMLEDNDYLRETCCPSEEIAMECIKLVVRINRKYRTFLEIFNTFLEIFFPEVYNKINKNTLNLTRSHLSAIAIHHDFKSQFLDWTFDPKVASWFACHYYTSETYRLIDKTFDPTIYILKTEDQNIEGSRFFDLRELPKEFLRPHNQQGGIIKTKLMEDLHILNPEVIKLQFPIEENNFDDYNINFEFLFPNDNDPFYDYFKFFHEYEGTFYSLMSWMFNRGEGPMHDYYLSKRLSIIKTYSRKYNLDWNNYWRDQLFNDYGVEKISKTFDGEWEEYKKRFIDTLNSNCFDEFKSFFIKNYKLRKKSPFYTEEREVIYHYNKACRTQNDKICIDWNKFYN